MTRRLRFLFLIAVLLTALFPAGPVLAQNAGPVTEVQDIRANRSNYLNEVVTVEGEIAQYENDKATTSYYTLKGRYGSTISVRTSQSKPEPFARYSVTGVVSEGTVAGVRGKTLYLDEKSRRRVLTAEEIEAKRQANDANQERIIAETMLDSIKRKNALWIYGLGGLIILLIGAIVTVSMRKRKNDIGSAGIPLSAQEAPPPRDATITETKTIKVYNPPPGTLKVLPGRFTVKEGLKGIPELRFYKQSGQVETEITFGRENGEPYKHIQLKSPTVSSKQAKLVFNNGQYTLINYASAASNPTKVNGKALDINGAAILQHGDVIAMGEVILEYSAK